MWGHQTTYLTPILANPNNTFRGSWLIKFKVIIISLNLYFDGVQQIMLAIQQNHIVEAWNYVFAGGGRGS